ncbi:MAG: efflux RND transporter periplasmic adaptor subunit [Planctomycetota bacterium]
MKTIVKLFIVVALGAGFWSYTRRDAAVIPRFMLEKANKGMVVVTVGATGTIDPVAKVQVGTQVSGIISAVHVDFNDPVKAHQVICELDPRPLKASVAQGEASLARARAQLKKVQANLYVAAQDLARAVRLSAEGHIPASEMERAKAAHQALEADVEVAQTEIQQVEASLELSRTNLEYATIRSPVSGVVLHRTVDVGQTVAASLQAPVLFEIAENLERVHVLASVAESDIGRIKPGLTATFSIDAHPGRSFEGVVRQVRLRPSSEQNVVTYTVVVDAGNAEGLLLPGMTANLKIETDRSEMDVVRVPGSALRFEPEPEWVSGSPDPVEGPRVWVLRGGKLTCLSVKVGLGNGGFTEIKEGLAEGDEVVVGAFEMEAAPSGMRNPFQAQRRGR